MAVLALAGVKVKKEMTHKRTTTLVEDGVAGCICMPGVLVGQQFEPQSKQALVDFQQALGYLGEREVLLNCLVVHLVLFVHEASMEVLEVPRIHLVVKLCTVLFLFFLLELKEHFKFASRVRNELLSKDGEKGQNLIWSTGHSYFQLISRKALIAEQAGQLTAKLQRLFKQRDVHILAFCGKEKVHAFAGLLHLALSQQRQNIWILQAYQKPVAIRWLFQRREVVVAHPSKLVLGKLLLGSVLVQVL
mmetsp:Transcript_24766/g.60252  ORF Transcript_24766/g.60252 Transcript_24766/m.60252 type:complete len:247 (-) Transcript_24766:524-1264(-)